MSKKIRWGILGGANIAVKALIPAIKQSETGVLAAIACRDIGKANRMAQELQIPKAYGSYLELLADPEIDAVYIPLPNHMHREWTIRAARAKKHVLCEKPAALTERQAVQMVEACEIAGVKFAEAFMYKYHPRYDRIKEIVQSGEIGQIRSVVGSFTFNAAESLRGNFRLDPAAGGGSLYDIGCYPINTARHILGQEPEAATVHALFSPEHGNVDMMASGLIEFPDGVALTFDCGMWAAPRNTMQFIGTEGRIQVPNAFVINGNNPGEWNFFVTVNGELREEKVPEINQYVMQVDAFGRSILNDAPLPFSAWDAVNNMRVIDACLQSAKERIRVEISSS